MIIKNMLFLMHLWEYEKHVLRSHDEMKHKE